MAKRNRRNADKPAVEPTAVEPTAVEPAAVEPKAVPTGRLRLPLPLAKKHNVGFTVLAPEVEVVAANVALTSKGTNPKRVRVYGYDNLANGGGVPKAAKVQIVAGVTCPKGVNAAQWDLLVSLAGKTVEHCYGNKVASRTVRRAYRAGAIRFVA